MRNKGKWTCLSNIYNTSIPVYLYTFYLLLALFFGSCTKEADKTIPEITIYSPDENQEFNVYDTIKVSAKIEHQNILTSIKVVLVDEEFIPVLPPVNKFPDQTVYNLNVDYPINDIQIEDGEYYIQIRAEDGLEFKNKYRKIHINGIPRELEKIIVIVQKSSMKLGIMAIDMQNNLSVLFDVEGDYADSETDSKNRLLYLAGMNQINIVARNLDTYETLWQKELMPPLPAHSPGCLCFDEILYASYDSYFIYGYRYNGLLIFNAIVEEKKSPSRIAKINDFLLADLQSKSGGITYLATYYIVTGAEKQRIATSYKVVDYFGSIENNVLIFANENDAGIIKQYDPFQNTQTTIKNVPGKIICSVKLTESDYVIGTEDKILLFNLNQSVFTNTLPGTIALRLKFDPLNQKIYVVGLNRIDIVNYPVMQIQNTITLEESILNLHLFYNK
jgi:hypothetical protein